MTGRRTFSATGTDRWNISYQNEPLAAQRKNAIRLVPPAIRDASRSRMEIDETLSFPTLERSDDVVLDERLRLVEDLEVPGGDVDVLAVGQGELEAPLSGDLDVEAGTVEEHEVEANEPPQGGEPAD